MIIRALTINFDSMHEKLGFCAVEIEWCMCFMAKKGRRLHFIALIERIRTFFSILLSHDMHRVSLKNQFV